MYILHMLVKLHNVFCLTSLGDAEAEIRRVFRLARQARPCVIFLDEIDALVTDRYASSLVFL